MRCYDIRVNKGGLLKFYPTLEETLARRFDDIDECRDIMNHGADTGVSGFIYTYEINEFYNEFLGVSSHELYHVWNVKSIRPKDMHPYDFSRENYTQLGYVNSLAFLGFPVATVFGGLLYNLLGARKLMIMAFASHIIGLVMTIYAGGFVTLLVSSFFIGFANGSVEAACNPMIADMYTKNRTEMLNKFHVWFPGGIVIGAITSKVMSDFGLGWESQIAIMLILHIAMS